MKKVALVVALIAVLIGSVLGGLAFAGDSQAQVRAKGGRLTGYGPLGTGALTSEYTELSTLFNFTNPGSRPIEIHLVGILDQDGDLLYRGPYRLGGPSGAVVTELRPRQIGLIRLDNWFPDKATEPIRFYTVEIHWRGTSRSQQPLVGTVVVFQKDLFDDGQKAVSKTRIPMENI